MPGKSHTQARPIRAIMASGIFQTGDGTMQTEETREEEVEIANMDLTDFLALLAEQEHR